MQLEVGMLYIVLAGAILYTFIRDMEVQSGHLGKSFQGQLLHYTPYMYHSLAKFFLQFTALSLTFLLIYASSYIFAPNYTYTVYIFRRSRWKYRCTVTSGTQEKIVPFNFCKGHVNVL